MEFLEKKIDFTFGIITKGDNDNYLKLLIQSIHSQQIPNYEILIVGSTSISDSRVRIIPFDETQRTSWITRKKNIITQEALYDTIVYLHDYLYLSPQWYTGFLEYGDNFQICTSKTIYKSGKRCRDLALFHYPLPSNYHQNILLPVHMAQNSLVNKLFYISGSYYIMKKSLALSFPLDERLSWGQGEDVELSHRLTDAGIQLESNFYSIVYIQKEKTAHIFEEEISEKEYYEIESLPDATLQEMSTKQRGHLHEWLLKVHSITL